MGSRKGSSSEGVSLRARLRIASAAALRWAPASVLALVAIGMVVVAPRIAAGVGSGLARQPVRVAFDWPTLAPAGGPAGDATPATWMAPETRAWLESIVAAEIARDPDPLSVGPLARVGQALVRTGWLERVEEIRRTDDGAVRVRGAWRIPLAVVRSGGVDHLVAGGGELLPVTYVPGTSGFRVILNAPGGPPGSPSRPAYGAPWGDDGAVLAGLDVLKLLAARPWWGQVAGVDVGEYAKTHRLAVVTRWDTRISWGGGPRDHIPGEQSPEAKLARLDELARVFGRIDAACREVEIHGPLTLVDDSPTGRAP